jgi:hypothetical protein
MLRRASSRFRRRAFRSARICRATRRLSRRHCSTYALGAAWEPFQAPGDELIGFEADDATLIEQIGLAASTYRRVTFVTAVVGAGSISARSVRLGAADGRGDIFAYAG